MQIAGANSHAGSIFPSETIATIYRHAHGIPRLVNIVCDNVLINAYAKQSHTVTPLMVEEASYDLRLGIVSMPPDEEKKPGADELRWALSTMRDFCEALHGERSQQTETAKMKVGTRSG